MLLDGATESAISGPRRSLGTPVSELFIFREESFSRGRVSQNPGAGARLDDPGRRGRMSLSPLEETPKFRDEAPKKPDSSQIATALSQTG